MSEYKPAGFMTVQVLNRMISWATKVGISPSGAQTLTVRGRKSGKTHATPVNPLTFQGKRYLVAPRGETHWVRNLRAAGQGELRLGRKKETVRVQEVADTEKLPLLKAYLDRWANVTATHFGLPKNYTDTDIANVAGRSPVFVVV